MDHGTQGRRASHELHELSCTSRPSRWRPSRRTKMARRRFHTWQPCCACGALIHFLEGGLRGHGWPGGVIGSTRMLAALAHVSALEGVESACCIVPVIPCMTVLAPLLAPLLTPPLPNPPRLFFVTTTSYYRDICTKHTHSINHILIALRSSFTAIRFPSIGNAPGR